MTDFGTMVLDAKTFFDGLRLHNASPDECAAYMAEVKKRFLRCRAAFESVAKKRTTGIPAAFRAALDLLDIAFNEVRHLSKHPITKSSPLVADIEKTLFDIHAHQEVVRSLVPKVLLGMNTAELAGEIVKLFEQYETLIVRQLSLVHRAGTPGDYFSGLDAAAAYPSYRCSASNRGRVRAFACGGARGANVWNTKIGGLIWPSAVVDHNGDLYTGHADGEFVALRSDGTVKWRIHDDAMMYIDSTGALGRDGFLYMASTDVDPHGHQNQGRIWKIDPADGRVLWTFYGQHFEDPATNPHAHLSSFFEGNISLAEENGRIFIYAGSDDNYLYKIDSDGTLVWAYFTETYPSGVIWTKPLLSPDGGTVFIGELSGQLHAVRTSDGKCIWRRRLGGSVVSSPAFGMSNQLFLGCFDGKIYSLAPEDGTVLWSYQTLGLIYSSPAVYSNGDIVIGSSDGGVYRLDRYGRRVWVYYTDAPVKSSPSLDVADHAYIGNQNGKLYCISPDGRRAWSYHTNPGLAENDINSSPSLGADGTVYFGATTGEVFAIPADYYYMHREDIALCFDPHDDGKKPDIPPGGAAIVLMDAQGTPLFSPPTALKITDHLNMAFFAVDDDLNVIPATILPDSLRVEITPALPHESRVESMGRFIYIIPEAMMEYEASYTVRASGKYSVAGLEKEFDAKVQIKTAPKPKGKIFVPEIGENRTQAAVIHGAKICQPKEIDALGQAMIDSLNFALAPAYIDEERGIFVGALSDVAKTASGFEYSAATVNKTIVAGIIKDGHFKLEGKMRLIAQGANIPFSRFCFAGRFIAGPNIDGGNLWCAVPVSGMPDFAELVRVMNLADNHDESTGICSYSGAAFEGGAAKKPRGLKIKTSAKVGEVCAKVDAPGLAASETWLHVVFVDTETGELLPGGETRISTAADGSPVEIIATIPQGVRTGCAAAIFMFDLFAAAKINL